MDQTSQLTDVIGEVSLGIELHVQCDDVLPEGVGVELGNISSSSRTRRHRFHDEKTSAPDALVPILCEWDSHRIDRSQQQQRVQSFKWYV